MLKRVIASAFVAALLAGCVCSDKRVTVVVHGGDAKVTVSNSSETKADGNQLTADPDVRVGGLPIPIP